MWQNLTKEEKVKRFLIVSGLGVAIILVLLTSLKAQDQRREGATAAGAPPEGAIAYTFKDDADIQQFQQLVQAKQIVNTRIAVLQTYLTQEAGNSQQINGQLSLNYKIDPNKNYVMDPDKKVVREVPAAQTAQTATGAMNPALTAAQTTQP